MQRISFTKNSEPSLDLCARLIVVASYLYYRLDVTMMADHEFDQLCQRAADNWVWLSRTRQFMLRSASGIRASGFDVRVTYMAEAAAWNWLKENSKQTPTRGHIAQDRWRYSERMRMHWSYLT